MRILKANWKRLHYLAYLTLVLIALHIAFIKYNYLKAFLITIVYIAIKLMAATGFHLPTAGSSARLETGK